MGRLTIFIALMILGGVYFKYLADDASLPKYESETEKLVNSISNLPPTAAGVN